MASRRTLFALAAITTVGLGSTIYVLTAGRPDFDGAAALAHVEAIVACGERQPESEGNRRARQVILAALREAGITAEEQSFQLSVPAPDPISGEPRRVNYTNVVARVKGKNDAAIAWGTHFDTPAIEGEQIVGANDGGSGIGVLIELAKRLQNSNPKMTHVFVFFDGEEKIGEMPFNGSIGDRTANALAGSRAQAQAWADANQLPRAFILLDMVGDKDLNILWESSKSSLALRGIFERSARDAGFESHFFKRSSQIVDDHLPFAHYGVPVIDLIDFDYGPPDATRSGGRYWHSAEDTMDKLSAHSLAIVGAVCFGAVPLLEKKYL